MAIVSKRKLLLISAMFFVFTIQTVRCADGNLDANSVFHANGVDHGESKQAPEAPKPSTERSKYQEKQKLPPFLSYSFISTYVCGCLCALYMGLTKIQEFSVIRFLPFIVCLLVNAKMLSSFFYRSTPYLVTLVQRLVVLLNAAAVLYCAVAETTFPMSEGSQTKNMGLAAGISLIAYGMLQISIQKLFPRTRRTLRRVEEWVGRMCFLISSSFSTFGLLYMVGVFQQYQDVTSRDYAIVGSLILSAASLFEPSFARKALIPDNEIQELRGNLYSASSTANKTLISETLRKNNEAKNQNLEAIINMITGAITTLAVLFTL